MLPSVYDRRDVAHSVEHAHGFDSIGARAVENQNLLEIRDRPHSDVFQPRFVERSGYPD